MLLWNSAIFIGSHQTSTRYYSNHSLAGKILSKSLVHEKKISLPLASSNTGSDGEY